MNIIEPPNLKIGDTIAIIAPAGIIYRDKFLAGIKFLKSLGFKVKYSNRIFDQKRYLAGNDSEKIKEIEEAFTDKEINGIICARGGYGSIKLIKNINYSIIRNNPKVFCGYSDITALQLMFLKNAGLITYSAPMITADFGQEKVSEFTINNFKKVLIENKMLEFDGDIIKTGNSKGILWGGNLSTIVSLCGQNFIPEEDFIFFAEDLNEPVYKIDKMLRQLINIDIFKKNIKGIIFGEFIQTDNEEWLNELFVEISEELNIPAMKNVKISHAKDKLTVPIGKKFQLDLTLFPPN